MLWSNFPRPTEGIFHELVCRSKIFSEFGRPANQKLDEAMTKDELQGKAAPHMPRCWTKARERRKRTAAISAITSQGDIGPDISPQNKWTGAALATRIAVSRTRTSSLERAALQKF
jgi:hypothetical protein